MPAGKPRASLGSWSLRPRSRSVDRSGRSFPPRSTAASRRSSSTGTGPLCPTGSRTPSACARSSRRCARTGCDLGVVTGTHVGNVDGQLQARPAGPGRLYLCVNRGSEVFAVDEAGPRLVLRREATAGRGRERSTQRPRRRSRELAAARAASRDRLAAAQPAQDRPHPRAGVGRSAEGADRGASGRGRGRDCEAAGLRGLDEAVELRQAAASAAGLRRPTGHERREARRDRSHRQGRLRTLGVRGARGAGDRRRGSSSSPATSSGRSAAFRAATRSCSCREAARRRSSRSAPSRRGVPAGVIALGGGPTRFSRCSRTSSSADGEATCPSSTATRSGRSTVDGLDPLLERVHESLLTLADGTARHERRAARRPPRRRAAGPRVRRLRPATAPQTDACCRARVWHAPWTRDASPTTRRAAPRSAHGRCSQDGLSASDGGLRATSSRSLARPGAAALRAHGDAAFLRRGSRSTPQCARARARPGAREQLDPEPCERRRLSRQPRASCATTGEPRAARRVPGRPVDGVDEAEPRGRHEPRRQGSSGCSREHRAAWAGPLGGGGRRRRGRPGAAARGALRALPPDGVGRRTRRGGRRRPRASPGPRYRGHVFWDSDVFVLPFLAATHPPAARAMLEYRVRRLAAARAAARALGRAGRASRGSRPPTASTSRPQRARDQAGRSSAIRTGRARGAHRRRRRLGACCYVDWTGDDAFAEGAGRDLLVETARYWASRIRAGRRRARRTSTA